MKQNMIDDLLVLFYGSIDRLIEQLDDYMETKELPNHEKPPCTRTDNNIRILINN